MVFGKKKQKPSLLNHGICHPEVYPIIKENLILNGEDSPMSHLLLSVMGAFAEFERALIRERQMEGVAIAKKNGKFKGLKI